MDENRLRFGVGVLVIAAIGIGIILTFLFGAFPSVLSQNYKLLVRFPSAEGIGVNTNVVRDGVRIGRVSDIQLHDEGGVLVTLEMQEAYREKLTHRYIPQIGTGNLVSGDSQIEFAIASPEELEEFLGDNPDIIDQPYSEIEETITYGQVTPGFFEMQDELIQSFASMKVAGEAIATASGSINDLAVDMREAIGGTDEKVEEVADQAVKTLEEFQGTLRDVRAIVGDPNLRRDLEASLRELPQVLSSAQDTLDGVQETFETFDRVGQQFERVGVTADQAVSSFQGTVENIEQFTEPLAENGDQLVTQVLQTLNTLDRALAQVDTFGRTLNNSDGTLQRILEDDDLYWEIRRTVQNIEEATAKVRPILDDVRIFTDKVARDPRELGVRGALSRRPSGAGFK